LSADAEQHAGDAALAVRRQENLASLGCEIVQVGGRGGGRVQAR